MKLKQKLRDQGNFKIPFTAEHAENAEVNPKKRVFSLKAPTFGCVLCALRGEHSLKRYHGKC
jgi:hypothetical protein